MKKFFIRPDIKQYKANLHCHSNLSDGRLTPEELKSAYKNKGYSVLAITDHERPRNHSYLNDRDFLMITGYEAYIRPSEDCVYDVYLPEVHLNLFAEAPDNTAYVCYNEAYCKYVKDTAEREALKKVGSQKTRQYTTEYINEFIKTANDNGYLVSYNHPVWSMENEERILSYENILSLEIDNYGSYQMNSLEHNGALYNKLLSRGKKWFCHGSDDNHNKEPFDSPCCDSFGAFTMIMAESLDYGNVISAMKKGEMYSSTGPLIYEISVEDETVYVKSSKASRIIIHDGSKAPKSVIAENGAFVESADFKLNPRAEFFRVSIIDSNGKIASSRGFFRNEW